MMCLNYHANLFFFMPNIGWEIINHMGVNALLGHTLQDQHNSHPIFA